MSKESYFNDNINHEEIKELYTDDLKRSGTVYAKLKIHNKTAKVEFLTKLENEMLNETLSKDENAK